MGSYWANVDAAAEGREACDRLMSGTLLHRGASGAWSEVDVILRHTFLEVTTRQRHINISGKGGRDVHSPAGRDEPVVIRWDSGIESGSLGQGLGHAKTLAHSDDGVDDVFSSRDDMMVSSTPPPSASRHVVARVLLHMCHVEPVTTTMGEESDRDTAFTVASAAGSGARVVLRPRLPDTHVRAEWMAAVRAARDALPPPEIVTPHTPPGFDGRLRYAGWVRLVHGTSAVKGVSIGAAVALVVSDHDIRLVQGAPRGPDDLEKRCALRLPLASCRLEPPPELKIMRLEAGSPAESFTVVCSNGASFTLQSGALPQNAPLSPVVEFTVSFLCMLSAMAPSDAPRESCARADTAPVAASHYQSVSLRFSVFVPSHRQEGIHQCADLDYPLSVSCTIDITLHFLRQMPRAKRRP
jgi:hypothetical protein